MFDTAALSSLQAIGLKPVSLQALHQLAHHHRAADDAAPPPQLLRLTEVQREHLLLHDGTTEYRARALPALLQRLLAEDDALAVGDWVLAQQNRYGEWWVQHRLPPLNQIARRHHDGRDKVQRQVIVCNVDVALVVMGLDHDFNLRRLERYLAALRLVEVDVVIVLTKADLCGNVAARLDEVASVAPPRVPVLALNALDGAATQALLSPWCGAGQTLVAVGSSGAGKSTLTNALLGEQRQDTGANRADDSRGRHTTTTRSLHRLASGGCIIDTPGLRTLRLDSESGGVQAAFEDIATLAQQCRFRNCTHQHEPGCGVREAVDSARLRNFHKLEREAQRDQMSALQRKALQSSWKVRSKAARARQKEKVGG